MATEIEGVSEKGIRRVYRNLCHMAWCDGDVAPAERRVLESLQERFGLRTDEAVSLELQGRASEALGIGKGAPELALFVSGMLDMAIADGVLATDEQARLIKMAKALKISEKTLLDRFREKVRARGLSMQIES